ncbi:Methyltransferase domain-containing protein [Bizionia echini]|uniref:Methyltransferase domain-containing protein n=1 Tax=Bizionia echini TaxID=649333 RepID=A0A1I5BCN9_9FLAO|nr:methyltransferase domain-containing protein [Bizionia echini]SFN72456.1 Methyltransferase domain-containing protein [Bizionia echini]
MTTYEFMRWLTFPLMTTHLVTVRNDIKRLIKSGVSSGKPFSILDVGGRKSPYTINLPAAVTLLDVPQEAGTKEALNLGFTDSILTTIQKKRSNITDVIIQDMTQSTIEEARFDAVVSIEVIEHVEADVLFVKHIAAVIKKGGWAYFTTPNGDYIKNEGPGKNPDHVRHYTRQGLHDLLSHYFDTVEVHYAVSTGRYRVWSLQSLKTINPVRFVQSLVGTVVNRFQSKGVETRAEHTAHLIAVAYK